MKNLLTSAFTALLLGSLLILDSCKKKDPEPTLSAKIQQIVPTDLLDKMKAQGMPINEGLTPPNIEGIFVSSPHTVVSTFTGDVYKAGDSFVDFVLMFSNQNSKDLTVTIDTKSGGTTATGIGGFLAGSGNKFSLFAELTISGGGATGKQIRVFSGEITPNGIKDFYTTLVFKEKNDPANYFLNVGEMRVIKDGDGLASKRSTFRISAENIANTILKSDDNQ